MNRRQKMKRMKQELEWYKKQMVPTREVVVDMRQMRVETLRGSSYFHSSLDDYMRTRDPEGFIASVKDELCNDLAQSLEDFIDIKIAYYEDDDIYEYIGELKVVVPHGGDRI